MNQKEDLKPLESPEMHLFFVLDTSGSMAGQKIAILNDAMKECVRALKENVQDSHADVDLFVSVLAFDTNPRWVTSNGPEHLIRDFEIEEMKTGALTHTGAALKELDSKMSKNEYFGRTHKGCYMPIVIFMTDGGSNDDLEAGLKQIKQNKWFTGATKIGFAIGDDANVDEVVKLIGTDEALIKVNTNEPGYEEKFVNMVTYVAVRSSLINSTSITTQQAQEQVNKVVQEVTQTQPRHNKSINNKMRPTSDTAPEEKDDEQTPPAWPDEDEYH